MVALNWTEWCHQTVLPSFWDRVYLFIILYFKSLFSFILFYCRNLKCYTCTQEIRIAARCNCDTYLSTLHVYTPVLLNLIQFIYFQPCWIMKFLEWYVPHWLFFWKHYVVTIGKKSSYTIERAGIIIDICIISATNLPQTLFINSKALTWESPLDNSLSYPVCCSPLHFIYFLFQDQ